MLDKNLEKEIKKVERKIKLLELSIFILIGFVVSILIYDIVKKYIDLM